MDLAAVFLGTGGSVPSARRSTASVLVARGGERLMFDCGEGTQRQLQRSLGLVQVDEIYLTHFHADHILGLPGLLKTYDLTDREVPLTIYGPSGLRDLFKVLGPIVGRRGFELELVELAPGDAVPHDGYEVQSFEAAHSVRASGYALVEEDRPGRFDLEAAKAAGVPEGPAFAALQRGEEVVGRAWPGRAGPGDGPEPRRTHRRPHRRHRPEPGHGRRRGRCRAPDPRRQLRRGGRPAGGRNRPLDRRPGRRGRRRGPREDAGAGPHLLPLPRRQGARRGPRGLRADDRPARLRRGRDPATPSGASRS